MNAPTVAPRTKVIALAGNPNAGKTTLFNRLTGKQGRVGNYPGVTVELLGGNLELPSGAQAVVIDIPGTYSLIVRSAEEEIAASHLGFGGAERPDLVVVCVDATNLLRNLYLVLQLQEGGQNVLVALTMTDELGDAKVDVAALSRELACPVVPISAPNNVGLDELKHAIERGLNEPVHEPRMRCRAGRWPPTGKRCGRCRRTATTTPIRIRSRRSRARSASAGSPVQRSMTRRSVAATGSSTNGLLRS